MVSPVGSRASDRLVADPSRASLVALVVGIMTTVCVVLLIWSAVKGQTDYVVMWSMLSLVWTLNFTTYLGRARLARKRAASRESTYRTPENHG